VQSLIVRFVLENEPTGESVSTLPAQENEGIVVAVLRPRPSGDLAELDEAPIHDMR
jgi:hypothetical protein